MPNREKSFFRRNLPAILLASTIGAAAAGSAGFYFGDKVDASSARHAAYAAGELAEYDRCMQAQRSERTLGQVVLSNGRVASIVDGRSQTGPELEHLIGIAERHHPSTLTITVIEPTGPIGTSAASEQTQATVAADREAAFSALEFLKRLPGLGDQTFAVNELFVGGGANMGLQNEVNSLQFSVSSLVTCPQP